MIPVVALAAAAMLATASAAAPTSSGRIAYYRTAPPCKTLGGDRVCEKGIWTGEVDGTNERRLTPSKLGVGFPSWSPSGRRIAYMAATGRIGIGELWVMNENGGGKRRLPIAAPYFPDLDSFVGSWSRDEKTIAVAATRLEGQGNTVSTPVVLGVPVDGGKPRELFALPRGKFTASVSSPQFSPNGKLIAFRYSSGCCNSALYIARPDGSMRRRLASADTGLGRALDWSPDGKRIVFVQRVITKGSFNPELFVINTNGSGLRRLTTTDGTNNDLTPSWSPNGRQILFNTTGLITDEAGTENNEHRFAVVNADGSGLHLVGPGKENCLTKGVFASKWCYASDPDWSPR